jgi:DNA-directed RNA polymerase specialized sigma24 family protein
MSSVTVASVTNSRWTEDFEQIFREHAQMIYRTAFSVTRSRQDAEDVVQTLFLRLLRLGVPKGAQENAHAYLYRAAVNLSLNAVRLRARHVSLQHRLIESMTQLSPRDVEMLILRYEHNYSDAQIAKVLGKSRGAVAVMLYRARRRLKRLVSDSSSGKKS